MLPSLQPQGLAAWHSAFFPSKRSAFRRFSPSARPVATQLQRHGAAAVSAESAVAERMQHDDEEYTTSLRRRSLERTYNQPPPCGDAESDTKGRSQVVSTGSLERSYSISSDLDLESDLSQQSALSSVPCMPPVGKRRGRPPKLTTAAGMGPALAAEPKPPAVVSSDSANLASLDLSVTGSAKSPAPIGVKLPAAVSSGSPAAARAKPPAAASFNSSATQRAARRQPKSMSTWQRLGSKGSNLSAACLAAQRSERSKSHGRSRDKSDKSSDAQVGPAEAFVQTLQSRLDRLEAGRSSQSDRLGRYRGAASSSNLSRREEVQLSAIISLGKACEAAQTLLREQRGVEPSLWEVAQHMQLRSADTAKQRLRNAAMARVLLQRYNMRYVIKLAHLVARFRTGVEARDLVWPGVLGLREAIERFNPAKGCKFSTYSYHWIYQAMFEDIMVSSARNLDSYLRVPSS